MRGRCRLRASDGLVLRSCNLFAGLLLAFAAHADVEAVAGRVDQLRRQHGVAAMSIVLVNRDALLLHRNAGMADLQQRRAVNPETVFRVGSITKTFTCLALARAEAEGLLRLDQLILELSANAPFQNRWESHAPLTLAKLLEHSAGWFDMSAAEFNSSDPAPLTLTQALALHPASRRSQWPPGLYSEYSNSGPGLAAWVLEQRSGKSFEDFIRAKVFVPLGMHSASLLRDAVTEARLAQGYDRDGSTPIPYWHVLYRPAAGLNLDPREMAPMLHMLLNRGRIGDKAFLTPAQVERLEHPRTTLAARAGVDFGYGLGIEQSQHQGHSLFGHSGDADGYLARFEYSKDSGRGYFVVITAYQSETMQAMREILQDWLIEGLPAAIAPPVAALSEASLRRLTGEYLAATARFPSLDRQPHLRVILRGGQLLTRDADGAQLPLLAVDAHRFRRPWDTIATTAFIAQDDGSLVLQGPMGNWQRSP